MTPGELQTLFDTLGPEWRVFVRTDDPEEPPAHEWLVARINVMSSETPGYFTVAWADQYAQPIFMDIKEPEVITSTRDGHLLTAERRDPEGLSVAEFSTVTLTPALLEVARANRTPA